MKQKYGKHVSGIFVLICLLFLVTLPLATQQQQIVKVPKTPVLKIPDLILTDFYLVKNKMVKEGEMNFKVPYAVTIRNIGTGDVQNQFKLAIQRYNESAKHWEGERDTFNCKTIPFLLKKGKSVTIGGTILLQNFQISEKTLRLRALVDDGCEEFPPKYGHVKELREDNNFSNEQTITAKYSPNITGINPAECIRGETEVRISGYALGNQQGNYAVKIRKGSEQVKAQIKSWGSGGIVFTAPTNTQLGKCNVSIAKKSNLKRISNEVNLKVINRKTVTWELLLGIWDLLKDDFLIHLHNKGSGCSSHNESYLKLKEEKSINLPRIKWNIGKGLGDYIFLIQSMDTTKGGISLTKSGCKDNQLKLIAEFESGGKEIKGYWNPWGPAGCNDTLAPDIEVNNAKITVVFTFGSQGTKLDISKIWVDFTASVHASGKVWDKIMDTFKKNWENTVRSKIKSEVTKSLAGSDNKKYILDDFENNFRMLAGVGKSKTTVRWEFDKKGIHIFYY